MQMVPLKTASKGMNGSVLYKWPIIINIPSSCQWKPFEEDFDMAAPLQVSLSKAQTCSRRKIILKGLHCAKKI